MFFPKLCSTLLWISVLAAAQEKRPKSNSPTPWPTQSPSTTVDYARTSKCHITPASGNGKSMAFCYGVWPTEPFSNIDDVRIKQYMQKNLTRAIVSTISTIPLQILRITNCDVTNIEPNAFARQTSLIVLDLSSNTIQRLDPKAFDGLIRLQELILNTNRISAMSPPMFTGLRTLQKLDLHHNQMSNIPEELPQTLQDLNLGYNKLTQVATKPLQAPNLESLDLCGNAIAEYPSSFLYRCRKLVSLCIGNKMLASTTSFPFTSVVGLKNLTIIGDSSDSTPYPYFDDAFKDLSELQSLIITNYTLLNWKFLVNLEQLQSLRLKWVQVQDQLKKEDFMYCPNLEILDLTGSEAIAQEITQNQMFFHLQSLKKLILTDCHITQLGWLPLSITPPIRPLEPKMLPKLQFLDISKNPLQCKEENTERALCFLNKMTGNFSSSWNYNTDPRIVNHESTIPPWNVDDYNEEHLDHSEIPNDHHNNPPNQDKFHFSLMEPQDTTCADWNQQPVTRIQELCQNVQNSTTPSYNDGNTEEIVDHSSGLSTETIWYIVLGVILGLLLLTAIILCIVCTKNRKGSQEIHGTDNPQPQSFQALKQATSSQDALIDGRKK